LTSASTRLGGPSRSTTGDPCCAENLAITFPARSVEAFLLPKIIVGKWPVRPRPRARFRHAAPRSSPLCANTLRRPPQSAARWRIAARREEFAVQSAKVSLPHKIRLEFGFGLDLAIFRTQRVVEINSHVKIRENWAACIPAPKMDWQISDSSNARLCYNGRQRECMNMFLRS